MEGETPLFCLTGLAIHQSRWREFDRRYLYLKRRFYEKEIGTRRAEYYEVKGNYLLSPANRDSSRNRAFLKRTLNLCDGLGGAAFSIVILKNPTNPSPHKTVYGCALQYLVERFHMFLEDGPGDQSGILIADSRSRELDTQLARSHLSFIFGHETGRGYHRILEAPLFADSKLTVGLQVADIVGSAVRAFYMDKRCSAVPGAPDYSHAVDWWPLLDTIQFKGQVSTSGVPTYGYRVVDWSN